MLETMGEGHVIAIAIVPMVAGCGARFPFGKGERVKVFPLVFAFGDLIA